MTVTTSIPGYRGFGLPRLRDKDAPHGGRVRQNDTIYQTGYVGYEFIVDTDLIERVEIIRGPGHTLYGANAMMGVINVITRRGRDINEWKCRARRQFRHLRKGG